MGFNPNPQAAIGVIPLPREIGRTDLWGGDALTIERLSARLYYVG